MEKIDPHRRASTRTAGVPRRFGLQKVMMMTAVYAVLFAVMSWQGVHPVAFVGIAVFITGVASSQALLYGGEDPRRASLATGAVLCPAVILGSVFALNGWWDVPIDSGEAAGFVFLGLVFGAPLGYMAGVIGAAVFLIREREPDEKSDETFDDDPFAIPVAEVVPEDPAVQETPDEPSKRPPRAEDFLKDLESRDE